MPVPMPAMTPQKRISCQTCVMKSDPARPMKISVRADTTTCRTPKRFIRAAANGPIMPKSTRRMASAVEISAFDQPNSFSNGWIITPAVPSEPAVASIVRKVVNATTQP